MAQSAWSNPQIVGYLGDTPLVADLGDGLGHEALVTVVLNQDYATYHPPGYPFRADPGDHVADDVLALIKPEADALVTAGAATYAGDPAAPDVATDPPVVVDAPYCSGSGTIGETLTCTMGNWDNEPTAYDYQWKKMQAGSPAAIAGATDPSYVPTNQDANKDVYCTVLATNAAGYAAADSNMVTVSSSAAARR